MIAQPEKQKTDEGQSHSQNTETTHYCVYCEFSK